MALKEDIQKVFEKSIGGDSDNIEKLAEGLSTAIEKFITKQTFRVDKLSMTHKGLETLPILPIMRDATGAIPLITTAIGAPIMPISVPTRKISIFRMGVDKDGGESDNPIQNGEAQSNLSEVRLREDEVNRNY